MRRPFFEKGQRGQRATTRRSEGGSHGTWGTLHLLGGMRQILEVGHGLFVLKGEPVQHELELTRSVE